MRAVKILTDPRAGVRLKASSVTVSTVGLVPEMERFCKDDDNAAGLAISLHAVTDEIRDKVRALTRTNNTYFLPLFLLFRESRVVFSGQLFISDLFSYYRLRERYLLGRRPKWFLVAQALPKLEQHASCPKRWGVC